MLYRFDSKELAKRMKTKRIIEQNIGLRDVAKKIQVSSATLSRIENQKLPDWKSFFKICHWLQAEPMEFMSSIKSKK